MTKVWFVNQNASPPDVPGATREFSLAQAMNRCGHEVTLIAEAHDYMTKQTERLAPGEGWRRDVIDGVPFVWLRTPPGRSAPGRVRNWLSFAWRLWSGRALRALDRPDIIIGSSPPLFAAFAAERLARRHAVPFVLDLRDMWPDTIIHLGGYSPRHPLIVLMAWMERYLYRRAAKTLSMLRAASGHTGRSAVWVPSGVELDEVPFAPPPERAPFVALYAGTHSLSNNLDVLLDAAKHCLDDARIRFRFVGAGAEKPRLMARAKDEAIQNVTFLSPVPKADIWRVIQDADAGLMCYADSPLYKWGINPNKVYDYLGAGRPVVIAVKTAFNPVETAEAGFTVAPGDAEAFAAAVKRLAALPRAERMAMGERGRAYIAEHHDYDVLAARLADALEL